MGVALGATSTSRARMGDTTRGQWYHACSPHNSTMCTSLRHRLPHRLATYSGPLLEARPAVAHSKAAQSALHGRWLTGSVCDGAPCPAARSACVATAEAGAEAAAAGRRVQTTRPRRAPPTALSCKLTSGPGAEAGRASEDAAGSPATPAVAVVAGGSAGGCTPPAAEELVEASATAAEPPDALEPAAPSTLSRGVGAATATGTLGALAVSIAAVPGRADWPAG